MSNVLLYNGFKYIFVDHYLFIHLSHNTFIALLIYVYDLVIACNNLDIIHKVKTTLQHHFDIKVLGALKYFPGLEVARYRSGINIYHRKYIVDILFNIDLLGCKPAATLMSEDTRLKFNEGTPLEDPIAYRRLVDQFIYFLNTHPDLALFIQ